MNVLSLFDGMSCGRLSLKNCNIKVENYFSSEIKKNAILVANANFAEDKPNRLGDIRNIKSSDLPPIDLVIGGSPCQDFSSANKNRRGLKGEKSRLFYEFARLVRQLKPKYFLLENVRMKKHDQDIISEILGVEPVVINSKDFVPQLRHRLYWTNLPNPVTTIHRDKDLSDILESGYSDRKTSKCLLASESIKREPVKMAHRYFGVGFDCIIFKSKEHYELVKSHYKNNFGGLSTSQVDDLKSRIDLSVYDGLRYMSTSEKEALQGIPKGYTSCVKPSAASNMIGDGWTVDVISHLLSGLAQSL